MSVLLILAAVGSIACAMWAGAKAEANVTSVAAERPKRISLAGSFRHVSEYTPAGRRYVRIGMAWLAFALLLGVLYVLSLP